MKTVLVFDTESTGLPLYKERSDHPDQPHLAEISATLYSEQGEELERLTHIIKPDGWVISQEVAEIHGITQELADADGIPEVEALALFLALSEKADELVAHNIAFDDRIMRIAIKRYIGDEAAELFKNKPRFCTCREAKEVCKIPSKSGKGFKLPTLAEAYQHFTGQDFDNAHTAEADTNACATVYFALMAIRDSEPEPAPELPLDDDFVVGM